MTGPTTVTVGVSAGNDVVCCAVLTSDADGRDTFDYRTVTAEGLRSDTGDLVATALDLASEHLVATTGDHVAVAQRAGADQRSVLSAARRRGAPLTRDSLVSETDAALCWLRHTGEVARFATVMVVDVGASGTSVSVVDQVDGTVRAAERTRDVGGMVFDDRLQYAVASRVPHVAPADRVVVAARLRTAKEHLSFQESVTVDLPTGEALTVSRTELVDALEAPLRILREVITRVAAHSTPPDAVAIIGGGAFVPAVCDAVADAADLPIITTTEPDAAVAKGAALMARSFEHPVPQAHSATSASLAASVRSVGLLAGGCAAAAVVLAYGVQALTPSTEPSVTTVSTSTLPATVSSVDPAPVADPPELTGGWADPAPLPEFPTITPWPTTDYTYTAPGYPNSIPDRTEPTIATPTETDPPTPTTPSLRPAPGLPIIELPGFPELPPWWAELPGVSPTPPAPTSPAGPPAVSPTPVSPTPASPTPATPAPVGPTPATPPPVAPNSVAPDSGLVNPEGDPNAVGPVVTTSPERGSP